MSEPKRCDWFPYCKCGMAIGTGRVELCYVDDAPELTLEDLELIDGVWMIGGKVVSEEEGKAAMLAALEVRGSQDA